MSWTINGVVDTAADDWTQQVLDLEVQPEPTDEIKEEQHKAAKWAKETVIDAIDCNVVGRHGLKYRVYVLGHSNPGNKPKKGWVNDNVSVQVTSMEEQPNE